MGSTTNNSKRAFGIGKLLRRFTLLMVFLCLSACESSESLPQLPEAIQKQQAAFNDKDVAALGAGVTDDFAWYAVRDGTTSVEVAGREALMEGMRAYFTSLPSVQSRIESFSVLQDQVAVVERVSWAAPDGTPRTQAAMAVYQLRGNAIKSVYYFEEVP